MEALKKYRLLIPITICVIYILLRLWNLTSTCLWFDEIFSVHAAEFDWENLLWFVAQDLIHPPLFYILFKYWILIAGESLFWLRFFPVFFSIISLIPFFLLWRELKLSFLAFTLALLFFAVNGSLIKYAQEVRMYSLLLCLALFSFWLFVRYYNLGKNFWVLTLINVLLIYTHYFGWLLVVSQILAILIFQNIKIRQMLIMLGLLLLSFAPWVLILLEATKLNANFAQNLGWMSKPGWETVLQFIFDLLEPFFYQQTTADAPSIYLITVPILLVSLIAIVIYFVNWNSNDENEKNRFLMISIFTTVPVLLSFGASWLLPYSIWGTRHLIIVFIPLYILSAIVFSKLQIPALKITIISLILTLIGVSLVFQIQRQDSKFILCAFQEFADELPPTSENTFVYVFEDDVAYHLWFALQRSKEKSFQVVKVNNMTGIEEDKSYFLPRGFNGVKTINEDALEGEHFWIAFRDVTWSRSRPPLRNLVSRKYKIGEPKTIEAQGVNAFLVEVWKEK